MSDLTSKEKADRLRQLADLVDDMPHAVAWEVQRALREHADLVERPSEASGIPSDDLRRLWNAEVDDADKLLTALGLGDKETISEQYRSEGGFLRVGKIVSALKERGIPHEPQGLRSGDRVEWRGCAGKVVNANVAYVTLDSGHSHTLPLDELVRVPLTKGETP